MKMKTNSYTLLFVSAFLCLSSCAGSKKIDFSTAYKFSRYNYQKADDINAGVKLDNREITGIYASNKPATLENKSDNLEKIEQNILDKINVIKADIKSLEPEEIVTKVNQLNRKEKRALKKEIKAELKHLKNSGVEYPSSVTEGSQTNELTEFMRLSIIIGSAGLVLLLLGAIFSVGFLSIVGALAIVGAAVLFILDQV